MNSNYANYISDMIPKMGTLQRIVLKYLDKSDPIHVDTLPEMPREVFFIVDKYFNLLDILKRMQRLHNSDIEESYAEEFIYPTMYKDFLRYHDLCTRYMKTIKEKYHRYWDVER